MTKQKGLSGFTRFSEWTAYATGHPIAFIGSALMVVVWAAAGPVFGFSDTWQLIANTATTIITYLMVFLIQNTQNRDSRVIHLKLNEVIRALDAAKNELLDADELDDCDLNDLKAEYKGHAKSARGDTSEASSTHG